MKMLLNPIRIKEKVNSPHLYREGLTDFPKVQIDTLSFIPLSDKVLSILSGNPTFHFDEIESDYDEPESDNWNGIDENEENINTLQIDEYSDKVDVIEVQKDINEKYQKAKTFVEKSIIDESKNKKDITSKSETTIQAESEENK